MNNELYWLWLTLKVTQSKKITQLIEYFKTIESVYESEKDELESVFGIEIASLLTDKSLDEARKTYDEVRKVGAYIITFDSEEYPQILRYIYDPPYVLYARGNLLDWESFVGIGVVGTRRCDSYGSEATKKICRDLVKNDIVIVSGLALGIDSVAAREALRADKPTIAVIGNGIDSIYPAANEELFLNIEQRGLILSEYPPGFGAKPWTFPQRNRIISGLSNGVLVSQAPKKSGALITARLAMEEGKDVFAIPGSILNKNCEGSNRLIADGAIPVLDADSILNEYPDYKSKKPKIMKKYEGDLSNSHVEIKESPIDLSGITSQQQRICESIARGFEHVDEIARETDMPVGALNGELVMLGIMGIIEELPGNKYKLKLKGDI